MARAPIELRVATRVKALREKQRLSQGQLARLAKTSRSQITLIESGRRAPRIATLEALATALGVSVAKLVAEDNSSAAPRGAPDSVDRLAETIRSRGPAFVKTIERLVKEVGDLVDQPQRRTPRAR